VRSSRAFPLNVTPVVEPSRTAGCHALAVRCTAYVHHSVWHHVGSNVHRNEAVGRQCLTLVRVVGGMAAHGASQHQTSHPRARGGRISASLVTVSVRVGA
jgi:hypothetical protein